MRWLRSYRFLLTFCFLIGILIFIYRLNSIRRQTKISFSTNILSKRIDQRLEYLQEHFKHANLSMLFHRPLSNQSPSITYRCREFCGGWGDRVRGIASTFMLAVLTERRFYIDMPYPCEITRFLKPNFYNWLPINFDSNRSQLHIKTTRNETIAHEIYEKIAFTNFLDEWSKYDDIFLTTNSDYITSVLANKQLIDRVRLLNLSSIESTQAGLFPLIYEYLFRPTDQIEHLVNQILSYHKSLICLHIRIGQNPTMLFDKKLSYRDKIVEDMLEFLNQNLTNISNSLIFITSDSMNVNQYILNTFSKVSTVSIPGPIIHIDRLSADSSSTTQCQGFAKVLSDFYVLGECDRLIMARSGFSESASRRRYLKNLFSHLYLYCRGIHQMTGYTWKRPYTIC